MSSARAFPELRIGKIDTAELHRRREASIREAIGWPTGTDRDHQVNTSIWASEQFTVQLGKPGKEAFRSSKTNKHDMLPGIFEGGRRLGYTPTFEDVWFTFERWAQNDAAVVDLFGCLLFRAAYMLDHTEMSPNVWRYAPPASVIAEIDRRKTVASVAGRHVPARVLLQFIEALALNEDVKYHTLAEDLQPGTGMSRINGGIGRTNSLSTSVHVIAVLLRRRPIVGLIERLGRSQGMAPLDPASAKAVFELLGD